ncbi:MAG: hypothetical protein ACI4TI_04180, partial [Christensenellales bacterium]
MKLKKVILTFLIILLGLGGSLFGCTQKPLNLFVKDGEETVSKISLTLPLILDEDNTGDEDLGENLEVEAQNDVESQEKGDEEENVETDRKTIFVFGENANEMFKKGLNISFSEQNVVSVTLNEAETNKLENGYAYDIVAIQPKNVTICFATKDNKTTTNLEVEILQDCEKIEKNIHSEDFVVKGENKQLSNTVVEFFPQTTTNRKIYFSLAQDYQGIDLSEDGYLSFGEDFDPAITEIFVNVRHANFVEDDENSEKFVVENIKFDVLSKIEHIDATINDAKVSMLEFATNMSENEFNYRTITFKMLTNVAGQAKYENIDDSYKLKYYIKNGTKPLFSVKENDLNKFSLTISQSGLDGNDVLVVWAENSLWSGYASNKVEIAINVKTYPNSITVNGQKNQAQIVLYDNAVAKEIEVKVSESYNTDFVVSAYQQDEISIKYQNGIDVGQEDIPSGTKLLLSCAEFVNFGGKNEINSRFTIKSVGNENLVFTVDVRIIKNMVDATIVDEEGNQVLSDYVVYKNGTDGQSTISSFLIKTTENIIVPSFEVEIENPLVVKLESLENGQKNGFKLKALTTGESLITINFDNGLVKFFTIKVFTAIKDVEIDFNDYSKTYNI